MEPDKNIDRSSYLDMLVAVLRQHEKTLDEIGGKMEKISEELTKTIKKIEVSKEEKETIHMDDSNTVIYIKVKINRPTEDLVKVLKVLKE